ncbi:hypothetical protein CR513_48416, partial [Mucuna pruriens]
MEIKDLELKDIGCVKLFKPKTAYTSTKSQKVAIYKWVKQLMFPDGYASNISRCVDLNQRKLQRMKSHDYHVFMQWLLPIVFDSLPKHSWKPLVELSHFFIELTSTTLNVEKLIVMKGIILVLLWKLGQIFLQSFFDSMEHLQLIYHMRLEFLYSLKNKVKNKAMVETSICEAYLVEETSTFASFYYPDKIETKRTRIPRNVDSDEGGKAITYFLDQVDLELLTYIIYTKFLRELNASASYAKVDRGISSKFLTCFNQYSKYMNSLNHDVYVRGTNGQLEYDFYGNLFDIIQLDYTVLHIDPNVINDSLVDIHGGGEGEDKQLLDQIDFDELNKDEYITTEIEIGSDFNDTDTLEMADRGTSDDRRPPNHGRGRGVGGRVVTPSTLQDSFTPEYLSSHYEHVVDQRPFLEAIDNEFTPTHGPSGIIKQKFDESWLSWKKVQLQKEYRWDPQQEQALDEHWCSTDFQNKSFIAKANQAIDKGASAYCGGSISTLAHYEKMAIKLQRFPSPW